MEDSDLGVGARNFDTVRFKNFKRDLRHYPLKSLYSQGYCISS